MVNKSRLFALLILLNIACTANSVCTDNPVWASFKTWATSDTVGTNSDLTAGITSYETNTPVAVTDLGHCK